MSQKHICTLKIIAKIYPITSSAWMKIISTPISKIVVVCRRKDERKYVNSVIFRVSLYLEYSNIMNSI